MKIAVLGGTFNPVHIGHLSLAQEAILTLGYDRVLFVPALISPFKQYEYDVSPTQRCEMLSLAIKTDVHFALELCEIERSGVSYTFETIQYLCQKYAKELAEESEPEFQKIGLIIGSDLIDGFARWKNFSFILEQSTIVLADRTKAPPFNYPHILLHNDTIPVSSSEIREKIVKGNSWQFLVPQQVFTYITKRNLYGCKHR